MNFSIYKLGVALIVIFFECSGDNSSITRVDNYLSSGQVMRQESLRHAALPCQPLDTEIYNEVFYRVDSTGAIVTLSSSVSLIYFYCSRLPSDGFVLNS